MLRVLRRGRPYVCWGARFQILSPDDLSADLAADEALPTQVLGDMPQKTFEFTRRREATAALDLSQAGSPQEALDKVPPPAATCTDAILHTCYLGLQTSLSPSCGLCFIEQIPGEKHAGFGILRPSGTKRCVAQGSPSTPDSALQRVFSNMQVLRLPAVCSKRFLTTKVDRCVTGMLIF